MRQIDKVIHQPLRLRLMACLAALGPGEQVDFTYLRDAMQATDGNLGAHLQKLEEAGYIEVEKTFVARKPRTFVSASDRGRAAFADHVAALKGIIETGAQQTEAVESPSRSRKVARKRKWKSD